MAETKLSKILNKLADNDASIFERLNSNELTLNEISKDLSVVNTSLSELSAKFDKYDYDTLKNDVSGIKKALYDYTAPSSIYNAFNEIKERIRNIELNGGGAGSSSTIAAMKVKANDPYIAVNSSNEIYSLSSNIVNTMKNEVKTYDDSLYELSSKFSGLKEEIKTVISAPGSVIQSVVSVGAKVAENDPYIGVNGNGEIYSKSNEISNLVDQKITTYDAMQNLENTIKKL